jgi:hypothetical protein
MRKTLWVSMVISVRRFFKVHRARCIDPKISLPTITLPRRVDFLPLLRLKLGSPVCAISDRFGSGARTLISVAGWKSFETS